MHLILGRAIDCFKCLSENKNNPTCEDPFHNNYTTDILQTPCMGGRKGRDGVFPATACIKITGIFGNITGSAFKQRIRLLTQGRSKFKAFIKWNSKHVPKIFAIS